jgi:Tol biopolymer transport system component
VTEDATQPVISYDGQRVAYLTTPDLNKNELWVSDVTGDHRLKLASGDSLETLGWSRDDTQFLFSDKGGSGWRLFAVNTDGTHLRQLPWSGTFIGFSVWEPGNQSILLGGLDKDEHDARNWRIFLNGAPAVEVFDGCGMIVDLSPDQNFTINTDLWTENSGLYQYSFADKKCMPLKRGIATYIAMFSGDGKAFYYSLASNGQTTIFRQPWRNGAPVGSPVPALKLPFALREDYAGNAFVVSRDLSSIVYARPGGHQDFFLMSRQ